jgi:AcrR family transcriptional regulator
MAPLHLPANMDQAHLICRHAQATPPTIHYHYPSKSRLQMRRLQEGHGAKCVVIAHPRKDRAFTPERPRAAGHSASQWCPQQGARRHKGASTIATENVSESFHSIQHRPCRTNLDKTIVHPSTPPRRLPEEPRHILEHHHGTASKHQPTPNLITTAMPDRKH